MKNTLMLIFSLAMTQITVAQTNQKLPKLFQDQLDLAKMEYLVPENVTEVPVKETKGMVYQYAVRMKDRNVEIRYSVRPIGKEAYEIYDRRDKSDGDTVLHPDKIHKMLTPMMYSKLSGGTVKSKDVNIGYFKPQSIKESTGADVGTMSAGPILTDWGSGYKFGFFVMLHKDNTADAYTYYLFEDEKQMVDTFKEITGASKLMYALKFK